MSYFSPDGRTGFHNFASARPACHRRRARPRDCAPLGEHARQLLVDLVRVTYYLLLPICLVLRSLPRIARMIQNFKPYTKATLVEPMKVQVEKKNEKGETIKGADDKPVMEEQTVTEQNIVQGRWPRRSRSKCWHEWRRLRQRQCGAPVRESDAALKFLQMLSIFSIGSGLTYYWGDVKNQKHGWTVWAAMSILFVVACCSVGGPSPQAIRFITNSALLPPTQYGRQEVRFGIFNSALFATITTDASCGAVNSMHDSFMPLGVSFPCSIFNSARLSSAASAPDCTECRVCRARRLIAGLMVGRTPEYLGKKIESYDVKMAMLALLILAIDILGFAAWAVVSKWGLAGLNNNGPHG